VRRRRAAGAHRLAGPRDAARRPGRRPAARTGGRALRLLVRRVRGRAVEEAERPSGPAQPRVGTPAPLLNTATAGGRVRVRTALMRLSARSPAPRRSPA